MDIGNKKRFAMLWEKYFNDAELPITFYYSNEEGRADLIEPGSVPRCVIGAISEVGKGKSFSFNADSVGCFGGKRYLGFSEEVTPNIEYFLSCGIPGKVRGERYKKSPELVEEALKRSPTFNAPSRFLVFKRWDMLEKSDDPEVVIFFATPDVLAGLFTLANFDEVETNGVFAPLVSGCSTIVQYPYLGRDSERPRCVIGMFDVSARLSVPENTLTFAVPMNKFVRMIDNMEESFLITDSWRKLLTRIGSSER